MGINLMVAGIGNVLLQDEGIGVYLVRKLKKEISGIQTVEIGTEMWKLSLICEKVKNLLIVDAVNYGEKPGSCYFFSEFEISDFSFSLHDKNFLSEILILKKMKGYPKNFYIFGVEPFEIEWKEGLSDFMKGKFKEILKNLKKVCYEISQKEMVNDLLRIERF